MTRQAQVASPHQVAIHLDAPYAAPHAVLQPGQVITGQVTAVGVQPDVGELLVELQAHTLGHRGGVGVEVFASQTLYQGPWQPGVRYDGRIQLTVPPLPPPYRGPLVQRELRLAAVIFLQSRGSTLDAARRSPAAWLPVEAALDPRPLEVAPMDRELTREEHPVASMGCAVGSSVFVAGLLALIVAPALWLTGAWDGDGPTILAGVAGAAFTLNVLRHVYYLWIARRMGSSSLSVRYEGDALVVAVSVADASALEDAAFELVVQERAVTIVRRSRGGARNEEATRPLAHHRLPTRVEPGRVVGSVSRSAVAALPPDFDDGAGAVDWYLDLALELRGSPDYRRRVYLQAGPGGEPFGLPHPLKP